VVGGGAKEFKSQIVGARESRDCDDSCAEGKPLVLAPRQFVFYHHTPGQKHISRGACKGTLQRCPSSYFCRSCWWMAGDSEVILMPDKRMKDRTRPVPGLHLDDGLVNRDLTLSLRDGYDLFTAYMAGNPVSRRRQLAAPVSLYR
jgi:hypothetical protein